MKNGQFAAGTRSAAHQDLQSKTYRAIARQRPPAKKPNSMRDQTLFEGVNWVLTWCDVS